MSVHAQNPGAGNLPAATCDRDGRGLGRCYSKQATVGSGKGSCSAFGVPFALMPISPACSVTLYYALYVASCVRVLSACGAGAGRSSRSVLSL
jgi:hypothetical protein